MRLPQLSILTVRLKGEEEREREREKALGKIFFFAINREAISSLVHRPKCCTHWTGGWVGPRGGLDAVVRGEIRAPAGK